MSANPILRVRDLQTFFKSGGRVARAVDGVTFDIRPGETFALVGESGSGKSVTALSILKLVPRPAGYIAGGSIHFAGQEISKYPPVKMRGIRGDRIAMIFQEPMTALNPVFTVGHQISEMLLLHRKVSKTEARRRGIEMLGRVGIPDPDKRFDEYPHQMSGGQRQRVMIAMALSCEPELLIADEPTTALDVTIQSQILALMRDLQRDFGTAVLLITHDMGVVRENAHRVGVMYAGRIVEHASHEEIFTNPSHPYTRLLLRSLPSRTVRDRRLAQIEGVVPRATDFPPGCRFQNRCPFVMDRCRGEVPPDYTVEDGHDAACFLLDPADPKGRPSLEGLLEEAPPSPLDRESARLTIEGLRMHFPVRKGLLRREVARVRAVDGVDLRIRKGETVALVGESGCGKTTVGKCIVRLLEPTGGSIRVFGGDGDADSGRELTGLGPGRLRPYRRRFQIIFQDPFSSLNPRRMIGETIREGMETHDVGGSRSERDERIGDMLERVGLDRGMVERYPHEFSGGQRQRICLARALAVDPDLVICDEATSSLDVSVQAQILNLLKDLQSDFGLSYLFITHDLSVVEYLADRVCVMYLGRIVEEGTTREIFETPRHPYTRALLSAVPRIDPRSGLSKIVLTGDVPSPQAPPPGCHFHPRCPEARPECSRAYPESIPFSGAHSCRCILYRDTPQ